MPSNRTLAAAGFVSVLLLCEVFFLCSTDNVTEKCEVECDGVKLVSEKCKYSDASLARTRITRTLGLRRPF